LSAALIIINILAVDATVLEHAGWTHPESDLSVYRWLQGIGLMIGMWAFRYAPLLDLNAKGAP
jgi:hypothetical protein